MTAHPLPELPYDESKDERTNSWQTRKAQEQRAGKGEYGAILNGRDGHSTFLDDASEICMETSISLHQDDTNPTAKRSNIGACRDLAVPTPPPEPHDNNSSPAYAILHDSHSVSHVDELTSPELRTPRNNISWPPSVTTADDGVVYLPRNTLDTVNEFSSHSRIVQNNQGYQLNDDSFYDASTDSDSDHHRIPLVRFAPTHTFLRTPSPPTPPPHQVTTHSVSPPIPHLLLPRPSYTSLSPCSSTVYMPYGPRTPPWGSQETLDRERRNRIDTRGRDMSLQERFEVDRRMREWKWRRAEEETRMGRRRSEGERVRAVVRKLYPDEDDAESRERGCILCAVM